MNTSFPETLPEVAETGNSFDDTAEGTLTVDAVPFAVGEVKNVNNGDDLDEYEGQGEPEQDTMRTYANMAVPSRYLSIK